MEFSNQTVVVTGAYGNLGGALARAFAARDANLVLVARHADAMAGVRPERQLAVAADLTQQADAARVAAETMARFGRIDVLCNVAGGFRMGEPVHETRDETWNFLLDLNVGTMLNMVRAVVPRMLAQGGGRIVNVAANAALRGTARMGAYCATKSAVIRLTESMAAELRERNVNVNCVLPTTLDTPENRAAMPNADPSRWVQLDDLAETIVFLASPGARAIHGAALTVG
ncbi:MAG TPA: SDR family NAD(P)-dependent oxidoreductase [Casimicrobiaceae bacterium]|nr:SDR family NAD(P)-dependent oxidoreductase [Casimicrobiaceae bacterium]